MKSAAFKYTFLINDKLSAPLRKIGRVGNSAYSKVIASQKHYNTQVDRGNKKVSQMGGSVMNLGTMVRSYIGYQAVTGFFKLGAEMEQTRITFQSLLQDVTKGNDLFKKLNDFANVTPFKNVDLLKGAKTLLSFQVPGEKIMKTIGMIGNVSSGSSERLRALTLAYAQMTAAGKLMGQDLLQFINAGFNPLQTIAKQTGRSLMQLREDMQKGLISSAMVTKAFEIATSKGGLFYKMTERQAQTMGGKWSTFMGKAAYLVAQFSESQSSAFSSVIDKMISMVNWIGRNITLIEGLIFTIGGAVAAYYAWIGVTKLWMMAIAIQKSVMFVVIGLTQGWAVAQQALNIAMMANPIGIIIALVAGLVVGVIYAWNKFEGFRKVILGTWAVIKGFGTMIKDYVVNRIQEFLSGITGLASAVKLFFQGKWGEAANAGKKAAGNLFGLETKSKALKQAKELGKLYGEGAAKAASAGKIKVPGMGGAGLGSGSGMGDAGGLGSAGQSSMQGITQGGKKQINVNTTVERLVENLTISSANITEGAGELRDIIQEELLRAVNGIIKVQGV